MKQFLLQSSLPLWSSRTIICQCLLKENLRKLCKNAFSIVIDALNSHGQLSEISPNYMYRIGAVKKAHSLWLDLDLHLTHSLSNRDVNELAYY